MTFLLPPDIKGLSTLINLYPPKIIRKSDFPLASGEKKLNNSLKGSLPNRGSLVYYFCRCWISWLCFERAWYQMFTKQWSSSNFVQSRPTWYFRNCNKHRRNCQSFRFCFTRVYLGPEIKTERLKKVVEYCISQESSKVWIFQL